MKFIFAQLGARLHYARPRALYAAGMLERFYTDICAVKGWPRLLGILPAKRLPAGIRRLKARVPVDIPINRITAFNLFGLQYVLRCMRASNPSERTRTFLWAGETFCRKILKRGFEGASGVYVFMSTGLELLRAARSQGLRTVMEQPIAPSRIEKRLLDEERMYFPEWEEQGSENRFFREYCAREEAEWQEAELIICGSEFVKESVGAAGGPVERCVVVPYGVDTRFHLPPKKDHDGPLRVLTVGTVSLRKGAPYMLEAAKILRGKAEFRMVGDIQISDKARAELEKHVELIGSVPRSEIFHHYAWADVFVLPSICEGSATVTYEALASGLPVITTPNAGSVVRDGIEGYIVPIRDPEAIAECIDLLNADRQMLGQLSKAASDRSRDYDLDAYRRRLISVIRGMKVK